MQPDAPVSERRGRIIIADDHELARLGLRTMLEPEPDLEVIGEAATGREAVALSSQLSRTWCSWTSACLTWMG
jgi:hypothetical protein